MAAGSPTLLDCVAEIRNPEIYKNFLIHLFVMIPAAVLMGLMARFMEGLLGLRPFIAFPWNLVIAAALLGSGAAVVVYSYGYLAILGEGSPGTHIDEGTKRMVVTGPYTVIRHPSVVGKLLGVLGLGFALGSPLLTFVIIPLLLVYSLATNRYLQERVCEHKFGDTYRRYRRAVPMIVPRPSGIARFLRGEPAIDLAAPGADVRYEPSVDAPSHELRTYLLFLVLILASLGTAAALVWWLRGG